MKHLNVEIKAICRNPEKIRRLLREKNANFIGIDEQKDTYFQHANGRLKLRMGNIEKNLIYYVREDQANAKLSKILLMPVDDGETLEQILTAAYGVKVVVNKKREIYFIGNVKFHIDSVEGLGEFLEIEAIDYAGDIGEQKLRAQCEYFMELFEVKKQDLIDRSYSDLLLQGK